MENENKNIDDLLKGLKKEKMYEVPEGYFATLEEKVLSQTVDQKQSNSITKWLWIGGVAASVMGMWLFFNVGTDSNQSNGGEVVEVAPADTSANEKLYVDYLAENDVELNWNDLEVEEEDLASLMEEESVEIKAEDVSDYLIEENIDMSDFYEEIDNMEDLMCFEC